MYETGTSFNWNVLLSSANKVITFCWVSKGSPTTKSCYMQWLVYRTQIINKNEVLLPRVATCNGWCIAHGLLTRMQSYYQELLHAMVGVSHTDC